MNFMRSLLPAVFLALPASTGLAQPEPSGDSTDLAKQLSNPISSLVSVPFQLNYDEGYGTGNGN